MRLARIVCFFLLRDRLGSWEADAFLGYQTKMSGLQPLEYGTTLIPVGAVTTLDGRVAYALTDWAMIAISGQNLLQSPQQQTSGADVERRIFATLSVNY
jgi:hypothetical protein